jgi:hypothetical protein
VEANLQKDFIISIPDLCCQPEDYNRDEVANIAGGL